MKNLIKSTYLNNNPEAINREASDTYTAYEFYNDSDTDYVFIETTENIEVYSTEYGEFNLEATSDSLEEASELVMSWC